MHPRTDTGSCAFCIAAGEAQRCKTSPTREWCGSHIRCAESTFPHEEEEYYSVVERFAKGCNKQQRHTNTTNRLSRDHDEHLFLPTPQAPLGLAADRLRSSNSTRSTINRSTNTSSDASSRRRGYMGQISYRNEVTKNTLHLPPPPPPPR